MPRYLAPIVCPLGLTPDAIHTGCSTVGGITPKIHASYAVWAVHHTYCKECGEHDWFNPGVLTIRCDKLVADGTITVTRNGTSEEMTYRRGPDISLLCSTGRDLFQRWRFGGMI